MKSILERVVVRSLTGLVLGVIFGLLANCVRADVYTIPDGYGSATVTYNPGTHVITFSATASRSGTAYNSSPSGRIGMFKTSSGSGSQGTTIFSANAANGANPNPHVVSGTYTVTAPDTGWFIIKADSIAYGSEAGITSSPAVYVFFDPNSVAPPAGPTQDKPVLKKTETMQIDNPYNQDMRVEYFDKATGHKIAEEIIGAGQTGLLQLRKTSSGDVEEKFTLPNGAAYHGLDDQGNLVGYILPAGFTWNGADISDSAFTTGPPDHSPATVQTVAPPITSSHMTTTAAVNAVGGKTLSPPRPVVGTMGAVQYSAGAGSGGVTDISFREGTGAIVLKMDDVAQRLIAAFPAPSGGTDMSATNSKLDQIRNQQVSDQSYRTTRDEAKDAKDAEDVAAAATATAAGNTQGAAAGAVEKGLIGAAQPNVASAPSAGDYASVMVITMPAAFGGKTINFNPMSNSTFAAIVHAFRSALAALVLALLAKGLWKDVGEWVRGFSTVQQAKGNPVLAGTGAQATGLVAAGVMTVAIVTALTGIMGWSFGDITFDMLRSVSTVHPFVTMPANVYGLLSEVFPIQTIWLALFARVSFGIYAASLFAACAAVIRFVVP